MEHTPGPWKRYGWTVYAGDSDKVTAIARCAVDYAADCSSDPEWHAQGPKEAEGTANAQLLTEAPNMLDALKEIVTHAAPLMQAKDALGFDINRIARAAIKAATS